MCTRCNPAWDQTDVIFPSTTANRISITTSPTMTTISQAELDRLRDEVQDKADVISALKVELDYHKDREIILKDAVRALIADMEDEALGQFVARWLLP